MLFNTIAYAQFFAIVFVLSWLLVQPRFAALLPWAALAGYTLLGAPSPLTLSVAAACLLATWACCRSAGLRQTLVALALNGGALTALTLLHTGFDPLTLSLRTLGVPLGDAPPSNPTLRWAWVALALGVGGWLSFRIVRAKKVRLLFILGASYVFYAHWDWRFLPLIFASSSIDWLLGNAIARAEDDRKRKRWLVATVVLNLGVLGFFKYFNFGVETASALLTSFGLSAPTRVLQIALPIGISFFTFESMSYVIDVYRRELEPQKSYLEYLSFVAFFPHLVAGPIVRPRDLLPQLAGPARWNEREGSEGLFLIAIGLLKKVAIGDYLALNLVDKVFDAPAQYSALECYLAVVGYAVQIYCDFSGYTDIAIGSALLLGVRFPLNFDSPYKARDIQEFWRRWHISLSTWLRDYLYIPLGGNRHGSVRTYVNLMLTMLLGGLWHGANWTFVFWGGMHGAALALNRAWNARRSTKTSAWPARAFGVLLTFHFVCAAWIFFRSRTFQQAHTMFSQIATATTHHANLHAPVLACLAVGVLSHLCPERWYERFRDGFTATPAPVQAALLFGVAVALRQIASADAVPFVYFQF